LRRDARSQEKGKKGFFVKGEGMKRRNPKPNPVPAGGREFGSALMRKKKGRGERFGFRPSTRESPKPAVKGGRNF